MNIGRAIKDIRKGKGWSQEQLAIKANITQAALSQIERGKRPGAETVKKIAAAFHVPESLLYAMALDKEEVPEENRLLYEQLFPIIKGMIVRLATTE